MYPAKFDYYRATSVDQALSLLSQHDDAKFIAGGHSLLPIMKLRLSQPGTLIDIGRIESLRGITHEGDMSRIGALTVHATVEHDDNLPRILTEAASWIGDPQVRNRGTVGGNVAHADPASDLPTVFMALRANFEVVGPAGERSVKAEDFCTGLFMTDLNPDELLTAVVVRREGGNTGSAYAKMFNPASRYAMLGAAAVLSVNGDTCEEAHVAIGGLTPKATRARSVEAALEGKRLTSELLREAAAQVDNDLGDDLIGDVHASADYRRKVAPTYVQRALEKAWQRAT